MRPGFSETWPKAVFFAGLWVLAWYLAAIASLWATIGRTSHDPQASWFLVLIVMGLLGFSAYKLPTLATRLHDCEPVGTIVAWCIWLPAGLAVLWVGLLAFVHMFGL